MLIRHASEQIEDTSRIYTCSCLISGHDGRASAYKKRAMLVVFILRCEMATADDEQKHDELYEFLASKRYPENSTKSAKLI